ncbi:unnamed protein product [Scytosiphon promiscuus]
MPHISAAARRVALTGRTHLSCARHRTKTATATTPLTSTARRQSTKAPPQPRPAGGPPPKPKKTSVLSAYTALLESRPLTTKAITSGIIAFAGDITCQLLAMEVARREEEESTSVLGEEGEGEEDDDDDDLLGAPGASGDGGGVVSQIDLGRTLRFTLVGAAFLAPALHTWYGFLIRTLPGTALTTVVKRVALDQLVFTPVFLAGFLSTLMVLDGNAAKVEQKLRADYTTTVVSNWGYWIPAQVINFRFVPPAYQVLFANFVGFFWNIYLSYQANKVVIKDTPANGRSAEK